MKKLLFCFSVIVLNYSYSQDVKEIQFDGEPENLGALVNSEFDELSPVISPDGNTLFITKYPDNNDGHNNIWVSYKDENGEWIRSMDIGTPLNIQGEPTSVKSITPDGNTILLSNVYRYFDGSVEGGGCSISFRQRGGWSFPKQQIIDKFENKNDYVGYFMSNDGNILLMSIEKKKGYGDMDIWVSFKESENNWGVPVNLGATINSKGSDFGMFLASDNKTLYFSSDGHGGYGDADIWMTKRLDDTWQNWSPLVNMGPKINTDDFDSYFTIPAAGDYAYFVSSKDSYGNGDIYRIKLPGTAKPDPVVLVYGKVMDKETGKVIKANINYELLKDGKLIGSAKTSPEDSIYKIVLPFGEAYGFMATADKYYSITENLDLSDLKEYQEIERNLYLAKIKKDKAIRLNNIFFETGKAVLKTESYAELNRLVKILIENPGIDIEISGHTDNVGSDEDNLKLSQDRAQAVVDYLTAQKISKSRLTAVGYGEKVSVADNETEEGRQLNRRVEFVIKKI